jgi:cytochrome P450
MSRTASFSYEDLGRRSAQLTSVPITQDIYRWYQEMLRSHTVVYDEARASWLVFRYDEVRKVLLDYQTFSSRRAVGPDGSIDPIVGAGFINMDPPRHRPLRDLISQAFTRGAVANIAPSITTTVEALLDQAEASGEMDAIADLAFPLPITVIAELLGVPLSDREYFRQAASDFAGLEPARSAAAIQTLVQYFGELFKQRRREPREDLVSALLQAEIDGQRLSEEELLGTCLMLLIAGHETVTALIGNSLACLDEHPESLQELISHPDLLPSAIEEMLRYRGIIHFTSRIAMVDTVLAGQSIKAGDLVLPLFAAAGLDERQFPQADTFDIRRTPNHHMGFGYGIHSCLGAPLARLETHIALSMLLERFPTIRRKRSIPLELKSSYLAYGFEHVPMEWGM